MKNALNVLKFEYILKKRHTLHSIFSVLIFLINMQNSIKIILNIVCQVVY